MNWPLSQDYNEAVQNPSTSFSDPDLKTGEVVLNTLGLPVPRSGNFADVYEFKGGDGKKWALKCFTRKVAGLQERYAKIDVHLTKAQFPFTVGFKYMAEGIRIRGQWFPLLKMEWVEGFTLNEFIRDNADKKHYLHALMQMWGKLTALLRDGNFAHADLQHGNVLLVPATTGGKLGLRLIDYDGMWVPALAETHSGEVGHPNFQHPLRLKDRLYNADVDRFPHLVIAAALRATLLGGKALWGKFDNGDNLLFKEGDLRDPANAPVFKTLWNLHDDVLCTLVGKMALATQEPLRRTPWLDDLLLTDEGKRLNDAEEARVIDLLGVAPHFTAAKSAAAPAVAQDEFNVFAFEEEAPQPKAAPTKSATHKAVTGKHAKVNLKKTAAKAKSKLPLYIGGGVAAVALIVGIIIATSGGKKDKPSQPEVVKGDDKKQEPPPKVIVPPKKDNTGDVKVEIPPKKKDNISETKVDNPPKKDPETIVMKDPGPLVGDPALLKAPFSKEQAEKARADWAKHLNIPEKKELDLGKGVKLDLMLIPPGEFVMGSPDAEQEQVERQLKGGRSNEIQHRVIISKPFYMAVTETTQEQYESVMGSNPSTFCTSGKGMKTVTDINTKQFPVESVSWDDATEFCSKAKTSLPTEAQWEFACRAGTTTAYHFGNALNGNDANCNGTTPFGTDSAGPSLGRPEKVRQHGANAFGLFDMHGNVREWCRDYAYSKLDDLPEIDPERLVKRVNETRNARGGSWANLSRDCRSAFRIGVGPERRENSTGFRVIMPAPDSSTAIAKLPDPDPKEIVKKELTVKDDLKPDREIGQLKRLWFDKRSMTNSNGSPIDFTEDGSGILIRLATTTSIQRLNTITGAKEFEFECGGVETCKTSTNNVLLVRVGTQKPPVSAYNPKTGAKLYDLPGNYTIRQGWSLGDGVSQVVTTGDRTLVVIRVNDGTVTGQLNTGADAQILSCSNSLDQKTSAAFTAKGDVFVNRSPGPEWRKLHIVEPGANLTHRQCLAINERYGALALKDNTIRIFDSVTGKELRNLEGHTQPAQAVQFTTNPKYLISASDDQSLRIWDVETGKTVQTHGLNGRVKAFVISRDGQYLCIPTNYPESLQVFRFDPVKDPDPKVVKKDPEPAPMPKSLDELAEVWKGSAASFLTSLSFSKDGSRLATANRNQEVSLLDARNGSLVGRQKIAEAPIAALTFADNNRIFAVDNDRHLIGWDLTGKAKLSEYSAGCGHMQFPIAAEKEIIYLPGPKAVELYSLKDNKKVGSIPLKANGEIAWMSITPDGDNVVLVTNAGEVMAKIKDAEEFKLLATFAGGGHRRVAIAPDGKTIAFTMNKEPIRILDATDGKELKTLEGHTDELLAIQFLPDGNRLVSLARDNTLRLWNVEEGKQLFEAKLGVGSALAMAVNPDGKSVAVGGTSGTQLWHFGSEVTVVKKDLEPEPKVAPKSEPKLTKKITEVWKSAEAVRFNTLSFNEAGDRIVCRDAAHATVKVLAAKDGSAIDHVKAFDRGIDRLDIYAKDLVLIGDNDGRAVHFVNPLKFTRRLNIKVPAAQRSFYWPSFQVSTASLINPEEAGRIGVYSTSTGERTASIETGAQQKLVSVGNSHDLKTLAAVSDSGEVLVKTPTDKAFRSIYQFPKGGYRRCSVAPDGKTVCVTGSLQTIVFQLSDGTEVCKIDHTAPAIRAYYSKTSGRLVIASQDGRVRIWDIQTGQPLDDWTADLGKFESFAVSADGTLALAGGTDGCQLIRLPDVFINPNFH